jgi:shikimate dehydrogenase
MKTFGLVGYPLLQSFSQKYFTAYFSEKNIDAQYLNFSIENIGEFPAKVLTTPDLKGLNVTIPYKQQVMAYLDDLDEVARKAGAVNVIKISYRNGKIYLKGFNSDVVGFESSLIPLLKPHHTKALILGTGGASKAVKYVLDKNGIDALFVSRNPSGTNEIRYQQVTPGLLNEYTLIVNTTPLGMYPNINACPELPYQYLNDKHLCYDLIYNPEDTLFLQKAKAQNAGVKNGYEMLIKQAERAWEIWNML